MSGKRFVLMKTQSIIAPRNRVRYGRGLIMTIFVVSIGNGPFYYEIEGREAISDFFYLYKVGIC